MKAFNGTQIEKFPVSELLPYAKNPRTHSAKNVEKLVQSLEQYGWTNPVLITDQKEIIAGHGRVLAAKKLGVTEVPCIRLSHLSPEQVKAYRIADNRLGLDSEWDDELLKVELSELDLDNLLTGFDPPELDWILNGNAGREGEDDAPELEETAVSQTGDIWCLGPHRLLCGDATDETEVKRLFAGVTPSVMTTDPPYGVNYDPAWRKDLPFGVSRDQYIPKRPDKAFSDTVADWSDVYRIAQINVIYVWHAPGAFSIDVMAGIIRAGYEIRATLIWVKEHAALSQGHYSYQHEPCCYAVLKGKTANWKGNSYESSIMQLKMVKKNSGEDFVSKHGCQKPVECMRRPIRNHTSEGQAVYDPFMGSGTTIIAAETIGRVCYGIEINPLYVDMAIRRWQTFTGKEATRAIDNKAFGELEKCRGGQA